MDEVADLTMLPRRRRVKGTSQWPAARPHGPAPWRQSATSPCRVVAPHTSLCCHLSEAGVVPEPSSNQAHFQSLAGLPIHASMISRPGTRPEQALGGRDRGYGLPQTLLEAVVRRSPFHCRRREGMDVRELLPCPREHLLGALRFIVPSRAGHRAAGHAPCRGGCQVEQSPSPSDGV